MSFAIRPFTSDDYPALVEVCNAVNPDFPQTTQELRFRDEHRDPKCRLGRWVAERRGRIVGYGEYSQDADVYHPRKFDLDVGVHLNSQGSGLGRALYDRVVEALGPFDPLSVQATAKEDAARSLRFLRDRGFGERMREWPSRLDVAAFDPAPYAGLEEKLRAQEIEIRTLAELEDDPKRDRKLYELDWAIERDIPSTEPHTPVDFGLFVRDLFANPSLLPEAYFLAIRKGEYVGLSNLWRRDSDDDLVIGLTGTVRAYRRKGIALALKVRGIAWAKARGHPGIRTENATTNAAMLTINERLGFVKGPAWITFVKILGER